MNGCKMGTVLRWPAFLAAFACSVFQPSALAGLLEDYPGLERYAHKENVSNFSLGVGLSPAGFSDRKFLVSVSPLQVHYRRPFLDFEIFNASIGWSQPKSSYASSQFFVLRTVPKLALFEILSVGPMIAYEGHLYRGIRARLRKDRSYAPYESFSTSGLAWGAVVSQTFPMENGRSFKISQVIHIQRYSTRDAGQGWRYEYEKEEVEEGATLPDLGASRVFALELGILF